MTEYPAFDVMVSVDGAAAAVENCHMIALPSSFF